MSFVKSDVNAAQHLLIDMHLPDGAPSRENVFVAARRLQRRRPPPVAKTSPGRGKMAKPKRGIQGEAVGAAASKT